MNGSAGAHPGRPGRYEDRHPRYTEVWGIDTDTLPGLWEGPGSLTRGSHRILTGEGSYG